MKSRLSFAIFIVLAALCVFSCTGSPKKSPGVLQPQPTISLYDNKTGQKQNINIEDYLAGVVAAEMDPGWPVSALAAQAIIARTFTMENVKAGRIQKIHQADASTSIDEFQAYDPGRINDNVRKAVKMTRGEVAQYKGEYIKGWFSACDGGLEASAKEGLGYEETPTPYIKAGAKDNCLSVTVPENRSWRVEIPLEKVRAAVIQITGKDPGTISGVKITRKGSSGRVEKIRLGSLEVGGPALRLALGSEQVRSMLVKSASVQGDKLVLAGKGYGHGVGMCQWGANLMAKKGKSPEEIIKFYFRDIKITKLWK